MALIAADCRYLNLILEGSMKSFKLLLISLLISSSAIAANEQNASSQAQPNNSHNASNAQDVASHASAASENFQDEEID